ncbi:hypothetical protein NQ314_000564 [Rhamnusium bicolor]|uniref:Uncharacterized protein n=1 Tax=Rhamnusium bicolor TaxID=1586634 RepID=A0AAV8ZXT1_9CUCU|nr:hypothetical protein NQ314_000564 [Rhamnusium bicolor]
MDDLKVDVEYWLVLLFNKCGYRDKFEELMSEIKCKHPSVIVNGHEGQRASSEVTVNGTLVHSKLSTLAYPDYNDLSNIITEAQEGKPIRAPCKQQPITDCVIA